MVEDISGLDKRVLGEPVGGTPSEDRLRIQRQLDFAWSIILGGILGELLGMYIGRKFLSIEVMFLSTSFGILLPVLIAGKWVQKIIQIASPVFHGFVGELLQFVVQLINCSARKKKLSAGELDSFLKKYAAQRRWIACENVTRRFLAECGGVVKAPKLAQRIKSISPGLVFAKNQIVTLIWFCIGGMLFTFISVRLEMLQNSFPDLLNKAMPFLPQAVASSGLIVVSILWFILLSFVLGITLLTLGCSIPKNSFGWGIFGCLGLFLIPLLDGGLEALASTKSLKASPQLGDVMQSYLKPYLLEGGGWLLLYAQTGFLYSFWNSLLEKTVHVKTQVLPPLLLYCCVLLLVFYHDSAFIRFLPEALCFLFLSAATGGLYQYRADMKQPYWILIPCGGVVISILNLQLENVWIAMLSVGVALLIVGFLVSPTKNFTTLWLMIRLLCIAVFTCQCIRWYCGDSARMLLTFLAIWSSVGAWYVCARLSQFDATSLIRDRLRKIWLRRVYRHMDFAKDLITDTDWYQTQKINSESIKTALPLGASGPPPFRKTAPVNK